MKLMPCPLNGLRNISEFIYGGEVAVTHDPTGVSDRDWAEQVFMPVNPAGLVREWWCHVPTAYWFIAERNTLTDEIVKTYPAGELFRGKVEFGA